jgi:hypothetical protein
MPLQGDAGTLDVRVTATDTSNVSASDIFRVTVANTNSAPTVTNPIIDQSATEDSPFRFTVPPDTFADADLGDNLSYSASLPDGSPQGKLVKIVSDLHVEQIALGIDYVLLGLYLVSVGADAFLHLDIRQAQLLTALQQGARWSWGKAGSTICWFNWLTSRSMAWSRHVTFQIAKLVMTFRSRSRFKPGMVVRVKSPGEIAATLDDQGTLGGLPFMPEMLRFCGQQHRVASNVAATCVLGAGTRRFVPSDVVTLEAAGKTLTKKARIRYRQGWTVGPVPVVIH